MHRGLAGVKAPRTYPCVLPHEYLCQVQPDLLRNKRTQRALGRHAARFQSVVTESMTGPRTIGAAGAIEVIVSTELFGSNPPTANLDISRPGWGPGISATD